MREPPLILVVDDLPAMRLGLVYLLKNAGYEVIDAETAADAWVKTEQFRPDLVLLDVVLPDGHGFDVLGKIKSSPDLKATFVVHISAKMTEAADKTAGLDAGADEYITLPASNTELLARIRSCLRQKRTLSALASSEAQYRWLFDSSPQPMWIHDSSTGKLLATNRAFRKFYNYSDEDALRLTAADLAAAPNETPAPGQTRETRHRTNYGQLIHVEVAEQEVQWGGGTARLVVVTDLTARRAIEEHTNTLLDSYRQEIRVLQERKFNETHKRANTPLAARLPEQFREFVLRYSELLTGAIEERIFKVPRRTTRSLEVFSVQLHNVSAAHTDLVDLHSAALQQLGDRSPAAAKAQDEIARFTLLQLMGFLLGEYRRSALENLSESHLEKI